MAGVASAELTVKNVCETRSSSSPLRSSASIVFSKVGVDRATVMARISARCSSKATWNAGR